MENKPRPSEIPRRFCWLDSNGFRCWGLYFAHRQEARYFYGGLGDRPQHPTLVWIDEPPDWAKADARPSPQAD